MIPAETAPLPAPAPHPARRAWLRPLPLVLGLSLLLVRPPASRAPAKQDRSSALAAELSHRGLLAQANDVHWVREASTAVGSRFADASAVVLAQRPRERADVYLVAARLSPEGALLEV